MIFIHEKPSDAPQTAHLMNLLQDSDKIDSVKLFEYLPRELQKAGVHSKGMDRLVKFAQLKSEIRKITKPIVEALIYPPDDIMLCSDVVGYLVVYHRAISDTIIFDDGAKHLRHQINGDQKYSYYEGDVWGILTTGKGNTKGCNDEAN